MKMVFVVGYCGMVGVVIVRNLEKCGGVIIIICICSEFDLISQVVVLQFFVENNIDEVYLVVVKVGGIYVNNMYFVEFIYENLMIEVNIIYVVYVNNVQKLLFLGFSCIYFKLVEQLMIEKVLLIGILEEINELYVIVKIVGIKLCESYNCQYG